jgi:hypothetical protein
MKPRVRCVSVAVVLMLTVASVCVGEEPGPNYRPGRGGIGGQIGGSTFRFDRMINQQWFADYSDAAKNRLCFSAEFRYIFTRSFRMQVSPGLSWAGYKAEVPAPFIDVRFPDDHDKGDWLTLMVPISVQAQYVIHRGQWLYHAGAGPGVYRVWVENHREVLKDPVTLKNHRGLYWGGSAEFGAEHFFKELTSTSFEMTLAGHLARTVRDDQFPSGLNSNVMALEIRLGMNYYFDTGASKAPEKPATPAAP